MKKSHVCPKCGGRKLWVIDRVHAVEVFGKYGGRTKLVTVGITAASVTERGAIFDSESSVSVGTVECWACDACGYVEYYAHDLEKLVEVARSGASGIRLVDTGAPEQGPHR